MHINNAYTLIKGMCQIKLSSVSLMTLPQPFAAGSLKKEKKKHRKVLVGLGPISVCLPFSQLTPSIKL